MDRRSFISKTLLAAAAATSAPVLAAKACLEPATSLHLRKAIIWSRVGLTEPIYDATFAELRVGDIFHVWSSPDDPVHSQTYRVLEGPVPTKDPATMGPMSVMVEPVQ